MNLRSWQQQAFSSYKEQLAAGRRSLLWEATPGSGKTTAALEIVKHQLHHKLASTVLIVVPTAHLRVQWSQAASAIGLHLDADFSGGKKAFASDFKGAIVTYQQIGNRNSVFSALASRSVVVLDEIHHAGDGLTWGTAVRKTLEKAPFVLCLSGTAFRSDNYPIPFVRYDSEGVSEPDFCYSYPQAISDKVCRPTAVFTYGGQVSWSEGEKIISTDFSDSLDCLASARRLRSALEPAAGWVNPMFKDAHAMLLNLRKENPQAGGLFVCANRTHARKLASLVETIGGERPTVVLSDDAEATKKIKAYAAGSSMWLVACNMVSEGVDIPRLQVGVYGTTIRTKMYFRQFLGRIVRRDNRHNRLQVAYLYVPADPTLHHLASEIEEESRHYLGKIIENPFDDFDRKTSAKSEAQPTLWSPMQGTNNGVSSVLVLGNQLALFGDNSFANETAAGNIESEIHREVETQLEQRLTRSESKLQLASEIKRLVSMLHRRTGQSHSIIFTTLNKNQGLKSQAHCTEQQLKARVALLEKMLYDTTVIKPMRHTLSRVA